MIMIMIMLLSQLSVVVLHLRLAARSAYYTSISIVQL